MSDRTIYPTPTADGGVMTTPEQLIGIEEQAQQMLALLLALHPGTRIVQTNRNWDIWTAYLLDGREVTVRQRRDFWDTCGHCGKERQRSRKPGDGRYTYSIPDDGACRHREKCAAELCADFEVRKP
jgi:hypothetical protein